MRTANLFPAIGLAIALTPALVFSQSPAEIARAEYNEVLKLTPDVENGKRVYLTCAVCHQPEGWGSPDGLYPQIAGQLRTVIIKQLADIRSRNRDNPLMYPFSIPRILGGAQEIADVAAYVSGLPMTPYNGKGPGTDLERGAKLYAANCVKCHGEAGEGKSDEHMPAIAGQHYPYLMRQFDMIRTGKRRNADKKMTKKIKDFTPQEQAAVLDYVSRLPIPADKLARQGWVNPDFPHFVRSVPAWPEMPPPPAMPAPPQMPPMPAMPDMPPMPPMPQMPEPPGMPPMSEMPEPPSMPPM